MSTMTSLSKYIPAPVKLGLKLCSRYTRDLLKGYSPLFCSDKNIQQQPVANLKQAVCIQQQFILNETNANKAFNLSLAISKINNIEIGPGNIFSFWKLVGSPSEKNKYKKSRAIINGELEAATGGGLCQLSGLIYFLALQSGLTIIERHPHSIDIYKEEERFTPLGSDATVAYGYKDCRIKNDYSFPVYFSFALTDNLLSGIVAATQDVPLQPISFEYERCGSFIAVKTISTVNSKATLIANNNYRVRNTA